MTKRLESKMIVMKYGGTSVGNADRIHQLAEILRRCSHEGLQVVKETDSTHPAYHLKGTDNIILMWTDRYANHPMVIAGAGAGPEVTASGVLADLISISNI